MHIQLTIIGRQLSTVVVSMLLALVLVGNVQAVHQYSPSDVFSNVEYAETMLDRMLARKGITDVKVPLSREYSIKAMHVYELHISALTELYQYGLNNGLRPPPLPVSTPIMYTPTDVYFLSELLVNNLEEIYQDNLGTPEFSKRVHVNKTPTHVYQQLFGLYYKLNRLNGKSKVSPNEVYAQAYRAKEDLQYTLLTLSKRLESSDEEKKRLLVTAIYGMHTDGSVISSLEQDKNSKDVVEMSFIVREKLNLLREHNKLPKVAHPNLNVYFGNVKPIDVFLQTQFIIAELNLLKIPMKVTSTTNSAKRVTGKSPSDVYQEMKHIEYMLERLLAVL